MKPSAIDVESSVHESETYDVSERIVAAVAEAEGVDPVELTPLFSVVDPDALDALFRPRDGVAGSSTPDTVRFTYHGYQVEIDGSGAVSVSEQSEH